MAKQSDKYPTSPLTVVLRAVGKNSVQLSRDLGVTPQALGRWHYRGIPEDRVLQIEEVTGVPRFVLRPDLYPLPAGAVIQFVEQSQGEAA